MTAWTVLAICIGSLAVSCLFGLLMGAFIRVGKGTSDVDDELEFERAATRDPAERYFIDVAAIDSRDREIRMVQ